MIKVNLNYIKDVETMRFCDFEKVAKFIHHVVQYPKPRPVKSGFWCRNCGDKWGGDI